MPHTSQYRPILIMPSPLRDEYALHGAFATRVDLHASLAGRKNKEICTQWPS